MDSFSTYLRVMDETDSKELMSQLLSRLDELERQSAIQQNLITKLQQELIKSSKFTHDDPQKQLEGVQVFLGRAGDVKGRDKGRRR